MKEAVLGNWRLQLLNFLVESYTYPQFEEFIIYHLERPKLLNDLPCRPISIREFAIALMEEVNRQGLMDDRFFVSLASMRPAKSLQIMQLSVARSVDNQSNASCDYRSSEDWKNAFESLTMLVYSEELTDHLRNSREVSENIKACFVLVSKELVKMEPDIVKARDNLLSLQSIVNGAAGGMVSAGLLDAIAILLSVM